MLGGGSAVFGAEARAGGRAEPRSFGQGTGRPKGPKVREGALVLALSLSQFPFWCSGQLLLTISLAGKSIGPDGTKRSRLASGLAVALYWWSCLPGFAITGKERRYRISVLLNDLPEWEAGGGKRHDGDSTFQPQCERAPGPAI